MSKINLIQRIIELRNAEDLQRQKAKDEIERLKQIVDQRRELEKLLKSAKN